MMKRGVAVCLAAVLLNGCRPAARGAQPDEPNPAGAQKVDGYAFYPEPRSVTAEVARGLKVPAGFSVDVFANELTQPRMMVPAPNGGVYVTLPQQGEVVRLADTNGDGRAEPPQTVVSYLPGVHGIALRNNRMFLATVKTVYAGEVRADGSVDDLRVILKDLPDGGQHPNRTIAFGPDSLLYISIGSTCNACPETDLEHATMLRTTAEGANREVFAKGLRNTIGFAWHPVTREMWGMDQGIDWMGNDDPPEELNRLVQSGDYGWPFVWGNRQVNTFIERPGVNKEEKAQRSTAPVLTYQAHSAPIAMVFYEGTLFPSDYLNDAFVAMRGSWNRSPAVGYKVVRVRFRDGQAQAFEDFLTGFLTSDGRSQVGRPAGLVVLSDGSLLVSDDSNGVIYRVRYRAGRTS